MKLQEACKTLEKLLNKDVKGSKLSFKEFLAVNVVLLELSGKYEYKLTS